MALQKLAVAAVSALFYEARVAIAFAEKSGEAGKCQFENEPFEVGSFWDPNCHMGMLGCNGDGKNVECRLCGSGDFINVSCPPSSCHFPNDPFVSFYWDKDCKTGDLGCWADGIHAQCRYCGFAPYTNITCPVGAAPPNGASCSFKNEPETPYYWDPGCKMGMHGCNADGVNIKCRFCGKGVFKDIPCAAEQVCKFAAPPTVPYFWDPDCKDGMLGCRADGVHKECRFCAKRPFEDVPCPGPVKPKEGVCTWPLHGEPTVPYYWDESCKKGMLGCWADGIHAECRFCGVGVFGEISCPATSTTMKPEMGPLQKQFGAGNVSVPSVARQESGQHHDMHGGDAFEDETVSSGAWGLRWPAGALLCVVLFGLAGLV